MNLSELTAKINPFLAKAREAGKKALDFTGKQITSTPVFLKSESEYNEHVSAKRSILIAYDGTAPIRDEILLWLPVWTTNAWTDTAELKYISIDTDNGPAQTLGITGPLEMRVSYAWQEYLRLHDIAEIKNWWKNRCYHAPTPSTWAETPQTDPLHQI